jgi:prolyl-tRNA synthetase
MRMSQLLLQTLREAPGEARTPGLQLLLRGGFLRPTSQQGGTGGPTGFAYLPLGVLLRGRVEDEVCHLLRSNGGQPVSLPVVRPVEAGAGAPDAREIRFRDRAQREMVFGAGHETAVLAMAVGLIRSYRQLPVLLYEVWQQFRDFGGSSAERAGGLLGAREGRVMDAYGLYRDPEALDGEYGKVRIALSEMFASWNLGAHDVIRAEDAEGRPLGHAMVYPVADGEQAYARCPACSYAADVSVARVGQETPEATQALLPMQEVETPNCKTIAELAGFLGIPTSRTAKAVFLVANVAGGGDHFVFAILRGDTALNEDRLKAVLGAESIGPATEAEIRQVGAEPGYGSPVGLTGAGLPFGYSVVVDTLAARSPNLVAGANKPGYHTLNVNLGRDYQASVVADIATVQEGSPCPCCGSPVVMEQGVALAELQQAGDRLSRDLGATYLDSSGRGLPLALGSYRVYVDRTISALAERCHDGSGLVWPVPVAPYRVHLMTVGRSSPEVNSAVERVYAELAEAGVEVLFDDRDERAGVKFNDADLLGAPWRVAVGERGLQNGMVEVKARHVSDVQLVALDQVVSFVAR